MQATLVFASGRRYSLEELERAFKPVPVNCRLALVGASSGMDGCRCRDSDTDELAAGIELPPIDLENITSAAHSLPSTGKYRTFANGQAEVRGYDLSDYDSWLKCALLPAAYAMVEHPEHEAEIRKLFHEVSAKGVNGPYDPGRAVGEENDKKLDQEVARIRRGGARADRPSLSRWISMAAESGCAQKGAAGLRSRG